MPYTCERIYSQERTVESGSLPDVIGLIHHSKKEFPDIKKNCKLDDIDPSKYNELYKLIRVTAIILAMAKNTSFRFNVDKLSPRDINVAERVWIEYTQADLESSLRTSFKRL